MALSALGWKWILFLSTSSNASFLLDRGIRPGKDKRLKAVEMFARPFDHRG
jgi:hypothetical protein